MLSLFLLIVFGIGAAVFASFNTHTATVSFGQYGLLDVPVYLVVLAAVLLGIFISWLISLVGTISHSMKLRGKEGKLREAEREIQTLNERIHSLELENERLRGERNVEIQTEPEEVVEHRPLNPFSKILERFS